VKAWKTIFWKREEVEEWCGISEYFVPKKGYQKEKTENCLILLIVMREEVAEENSGNSEVFLMYSSCLSPVLHFCVKIQQSKL
jgi:hypothetical protein